MSLPAVWLCYLTFWVSIFQFYKNSSKTSYLHGILRNFKRQHFLIKNSTIICSESPLLGVQLWIHEVEYLLFGLKKLRYDKLALTLKMFILHLKFNLYLSIFWTSANTELGSTALHKLFPSPSNIVSCLFLFWLWFLQALYWKFSGRLSFLCIFHFILYIPLLISLKYIQFISRHLTSPFSYFFCWTSKYSQDFWSSPTLSILCVY